MSRTWKLGLATAATTALLMCTVALAQEKKPEGAKAEPAKPAAGHEGMKPDDKKPGDAGAMSKEQMEAMQRWENYAKTGEEHRRLEDFVGKWNCDVKFWMPGAPEPEMMKATADWHWILNKHFLEETVNGPADQPGQPPFEGRGLMGYDNLKKEYVSIWIDNMGTGFQIAHGPAAKDPNNFTFEAEASDPMSNNKNAKYRCTVNVIDKNKHVYTQFGPGPDGKEYKQLEITYTRMGAAPATPAAPTGAPK
jgi:hypothetical protein